MSSNLVIEDIMAITKRLEGCKNSEDASSCLDNIEQLASYKMTLEVLKITKIGAALNKFSQIANLSSTLKQKSAGLVSKWRDLAAKKTPAQIVAATTKAMAAGPVSTEYKGELTGETRRDNARKMLFRGLVEGLPEEEKENATRSFSVKLIADIETACFEKLVPKGSVDYSQYLAQIKSLKFNIADPKNPDFIRSIMFGDKGHSPAELAVMESKDMASNEVKIARDASFRESIQAARSDFRQEQLQKSNLQGQFICRKCKSNKTVHIEVQTRSSDEPMTVKIDCVQCGYRWTQ